MSIFLSLHGHASREKRARKRRGGRHKILTDRLIDIDHQERGKALARAVRREGSNRIFEVHAQQVRGNTERSHHALEHQPMRPHLGLDADLALLAMANS